MSFGSLFGIFPIIDHKRFKYRLFFNALISKHYNFGSEEKNGTKKSRMQQIVC